jgi:lysophospholipase L1-like esterase
MINFGDSITQGYDASRPENLYASQLAAALNAEARNKGIGGEKFFADLGKTKEDFEPDLITVAYGTNDWGIYKKDDYLRHCRGFIENLSKNYPEAKIFVITPIWRKDLDELRSAGRFYDLHGYIEACAEGLANVTVISGFDFVQKDASMFSDKRLHPNDKGFEQYYHGLLKELKKYI